MAGLYRPSYVDKKTKKKRKTPKWYAWYVNYEGRKVRIPLSEDKAIAQQMLGELLKQDKEARHGFRDPFTDQRARPLAQHLADWERFLVSKAVTRRSQQNARQVVGRVRRVLAACGFEKLDDIGPSAVHEFIAKLGREAIATGNRNEAKRLGPATLNKYIRHTQQFMRWCVRERRVRDNPLAFMGKWNARADIRHARRPLAPDEFRFLLEVVRRTETVCRGLGGQERAMLYSLAAASGLRVGELSSLTPACFALDDDPPTVSCAASFTKNGEIATQPLPPDIVPALREFLRDRPADRAVWPTTWTQRASRLMKHDLNLARQVWLKLAPNDPERQRRQESDFLRYKDSTGQFADFHALRHTYISLLANSGVHPKMAQTLARHSDINLTMITYAQVGLRDKAAAVASLPPLFAAAPERQEEGKAAG